LGRKAPGDFAQDAAGRIRRGGGLVYGGLQILRTGRVAAVAAPVFSLNQCWDEMIAAGTLFGLVYPGHWCDVGHPEGIATAVQLLEAPRV